MKQKIVFFGLVLFLLFVLMIVFFLARNSNESGAIEVNFGDLISVGDAFLISPQEALGRKYFRFYFKGKFILNIEVDEETGEVFRIYFSDDNIVRSWSKISNEMTSSPMEN